MRDATSFYNIIFKIQIQISFFIDNELQKIQHILSKQQNIKEYKLKTLRLCVSAVKNETQNWITRN